MGQPNETTNMNQMCDLSRVCAEIILAGPFKDLWWYYLTCIKLLHLNRGGIPKSVVAKIINTLSLYM